MHRNDGYPKELLAIDEQEIGLCLNAAVWDVENGNVLKIGEGKRVLMAYHGMKLMSQEEIEVLYGTPAVFAAMDYPKTVR